MYVSWTAGHGNFTLDVYGSAGRASVDLVHAQAMNIFHNPAGGAGAPPGWSFPDLVWPYGYSGEQQCFVDRVAGRSDGQVAATPAQARDALALVLAAQESLDQHRIVNIT
jgi:myo-inositol 2-dehydrogenase/D-chiro-inositol 1-dehydrogenase